MVTVTLPHSSPSSIQQFYVLWNEGTTGCELALGPFYLDSNGQLVPTVDTILNFGAPYHPSDEDSIAGQNPVLHLNAKGFLSSARLDRYTTDAFFSVCKGGDSFSEGSGMSMSDHLEDWGEYGNAYQGYAPFSSARVVPKNVTTAYCCYSGRVSYFRSFSSSFQAEAQYAGSLTAVSGHSCSGDISQGSYQRYDRTVTLIGTPMADSLANSWKYPATLVQRKRVYSSFSVISDVTTTTTTYFPILFTSPPKVVSEDSNRLSIFDASRAISSAMNRLVEPEDCFGTLCKEAVQSIRYISSNNIENAAQLRDVRSIVPPLGLLRKIKRGDVKALSELYLWYKYSFVPTCQDVPALINTVANQKRRYTGDFFRGASSSQSYTAMGLQQNCTSRVGVRFSVDPAFHAKMVMQSWGVDLSLSNAWDLIPFSFVVDWFTHAGDALSNLDYEFDVFTNTYDFDYINCSNKVTARVPEILGLSGGVDVSLYHRFPLRSVPFSYELQPSTASSHILEAAALIVTK